MPEDIRSCREVDDQLAVYIDGEQSAGARQSIDAHLAACPSCRVHAERERTARDLMRARRDRLRPPAPSSLHARCSGAASEAQPSASRSAIRTWVPLSLAATLLLAIGGVFVFGLNDRVEALAAGLVLDHSKCFRIAPADGKDDAAVDEELWRRNQGWTITVPRSSEAEQLTLVDVRKCLTADGWSAHLMYQWRGQPLSVYVVPKTVGSAAASEKLGHETEIWAGNGRTYAVLTDGRPPGFDEIVSYMKVHAR
jgi:anti-sigma factor RsiW